jgi:tRNA threonylcarbamoyladenosine biosynthesis protein TsaB
MGLNLLILAVDTSTTSGSIALVDSGMVLAGKDEPNVRAHAQWLMPAIDALFNTVDHAIEDVGLFAIGVGPGSFTGLRIGVSTVKGLAWSLNKPVAGVSTLRALAMNIRTPGTLLCPVLDARKKELYAALYRVVGDGGAVEELLSDRAIAPKALYADIAQRAKDEEVLFLGTGLDRYRRDIEENVEMAGFALEADWRIRAVNIAALAALEGARHMEAPMLVPLYKRSSEAELKRF